ncbi:hypothetical protein MBLNU459_g2528t1 [Dothideomycetes sp. NU459]
MRRASSDLPSPEPQTTCKKLPSITQIFPEDTLKSFHIEAEDVLRTRLDYFGQKKRNGSIWKRQSESNKAKSGLTFTKKEIDEGAITMMLAAETFSRAFVRPEMMGQIWLRLEPVLRERSMDDVEGQVAAWAELLPLAHERGRVYIQDQIAELRPKATDPLISGPAIEPIDGT